MSNKMVQHLWYCGLCFPWMNTLWKHISFLPQPPGSCITLPSHNLHFTPPSASIWPLRCSLRLPLIKVTFLSPTGLLPFTPTACCDLHLWQSHLTFLIVSCHSFLCTLPKSNLNPLQPNELNWIFSVLSVCLLSSTHSLSHSLTYGWNIWSNEVKQTFTWSTVKTFSIYYDECFWIYIVQQHDSYLCAHDVKHLKKGQTNWLQRLDHFPFNDLLGNKGAVLFPLKKTSYVKVRAELASLQLQISCYHCYTVYKHTHTHTHKRNHVTMTTHMWAPTKHFCNTATTFSRKYQAYTHSQTKKKPHT